MVRISNVCCNSAEALREEMNNNRSGLLAISSLFGERGGRHDSVISNFFFFFPRSEVEFVLSEIEKGKLRLIDRCLWILVHQ